MFGSFLTALSGLNAAGTSIDSIGSDLANLNTTGYKGNSLSFEDVVADVTSAAQHQIGSGNAKRGRRGDKREAERGGRSEDAAHYKIRRCDNTLYSISRARTIRWNHRPANPATTDTTLPSMPLKP